jgi:hypothetical protein
MSDEADSKDSAAEGTGSNLWTDLGLTLPIFVLYHLGVVFLPMRNAADPVTGELKALANQSLPLYASLTVAIGAAFVLLMSLIGKAGVLQLWRFGLVAAEGVAYAIAMRVVGGWALDAIPLSGGAGGLLEPGAFPAIVMSLGAGFYEEIVFRVGLFGSGAWVIKTMEGWGPTGVAMLVGWAVCAALAFSGWHHIGPMADAFDMRVFVYRAVCGLVLTAIFVFRGFAPAVWTHVLYDVWAMG